MKIKIAIIIVLVLLVSAFSGCTEEDWLWYAENEGSSEEENTTPEGYYESCVVSVYTSVTVTSYKWNNTNQNFDHDSVDGCEVLLYVIKSDGYSQKFTVITQDYGQVWRAYLTNIHLEEGQSIHVDAWVTVGDTLLNDYREITFEDASERGRRDSRDWVASFKFSAEIPNIE
jgi:hypothetical protein